MGNINRKMETIGKNQKEMWEFKNTVTKIKNVLEGLICRLGTAERRISDLEDISTEIFQTEGREKNERKLKRTEYKSTVGQLQKM